jgi:hypothetical protein
MKSRLPVSGCIVLTICALTALTSAQIVPVTARNAANGTPIYDIDQPGRIPYQATQVARTIYDYVVTFTFNAVPAGHRLVIQQVSAQISMCCIVPSDVRLLALVSTPGFHDVYSFAPAPFIGGSDEGSFAQPLQFYFDEAEQPMVQLTSPTTKFRYVGVTLVGYELDCTVAPCAPIAGRDNDHRSTVPGIVK